MKVKVEKSKYIIRIRLNFRTNLVRTKKMILIKVDAIIIVYREIGLIFEYCIKDSVKCGNEKLNEFPFN